jgi:hypothetical protein
MLQHLPTGDFRWVDKADYPELMRKMNNNEVSPTAREGYILEVDLKYSKELHEAHTDYPLAPETLQVPREWLGKWQVKELERENSKYIKCDKLVPNLNDKVKYVIHYRNLQFYKNQGLEITKIHRAIKFSQSPWMAEYIELNTSLRQKATTDFEKDFFKLMNNSVFGKSMESLRKRKRIDLIQPQNKPEKYLKLKNDNTFKNRKIIAENLVAIERKKVEIVMNRPTYIGFSVLELSKLCMYSFYYRILKPRYGENMRLCYTDTDSLILEISTENVYDDMIDMADHFDFSDYPEDHPVVKALGKEKVAQNKKVPGLFKDELCGKVMAEFIGLRSKMYSYIKAGDNTNSPKDGGRRAKGVPRNIVQDEFSQQRYRDVLFTGKKDEVQFTTIRSSNHKLQTLELNRIGLSRFDSKKYILSDGLDTIAFGDYRIAEYEKDIVEEYITWLCA